MRCVSDRRFGIEIEHGSPLSCQRVDEMLNAKGINSSSGYDGSGVECRIGPLQGKEGFNAVRTAMTVLREAGGYVTTEDGMHVHFEAKDFMGPANVEKVHKLVDTWRNAEDAINAFVIPYRRDYDCCPKMWSKKGYHSEYGDANTRALKAGNGDYRGSYWERGDLNLENVMARSTYQPTIEIRLHEGCLDPDIALAWVTLGQRIIDQAAKGHRLNDCTDPEVLLRRLRIPKAQTAVLLDKASNIHAIEDTIMREDGAYYNDRDRWCDECGDYEAEEEGLCRGCHDHIIVAAREAQTFIGGQHNVTLNGRYRYAWEFSVVPGCVCAQCMRGNELRKEYVADRYQTNRNVVL